jgi:hypothetical protein
LFSRRTAAFSGIVWPLAAIATEQAAVHALDFGSWRFWVNGAFVLVVALGGWAASSLAQLAQWTEGWPARLKVLQGLVTSVMAGVIAYALAVYAGTPDIPSMVGAALAGWGGEKFLNPLLERFFSKSEKQ